MIWLKFGDDLFITENWSLKVEFPEGQGLGAHIYRSESYNNHDYYGCNWILIATLSGDKSESYYNFLIADAINMEFFKTGGQRS